jgi:hypothetical protein
MSVVSDHDPGEDRKECDISIVNRLPHTTIVLCWVNEEGKLFHYRHIHGHNDDVADGSPTDKGANVQSECGFTNHAFVGYALRSNHPELVKKPKYLHEVDPKVR